MKLRALVLVLVASFYAVVGVSACGGGHHAAQKVYHTKFGVSAHSPTFGLPPKGLQLPRPSTQRSALMLDTVGLSAFSGLDPHVVAGYTSGSWPTYWQMVGKYPHVIAVMVYQTHNGIRGHRSCLDSEPGDAPASATGPWARRELALGIVPCVYTSLSWMPGVKASLAGSLGAGWRAKVMLWDANWTFVYHLDSGYDCTQYTDRYLSRNIDGSACSLAFAKIAAKPPQPRCFGSRSTSASRSTATCKRVRTKVASQSRARIATSRALRRGGCRHPYRRRTCQILGQRYSWFTATIREELKQYG